MKDIHQFELRNPYVKRVREFPNRIFGAPLTEENKGILKGLFAEWSASSREIFVELGSGSGNHLIDLAAAHPQVICVGLELRYKRAVRTIEKADMLKIDNLIVLRGDGRLFLNDYLPQRSISRFYVNFPDPWPKQRQRKNRVVTGDFLRQVSGWLTPKGLFYFRTDQLDYFEQVLQTFTDEVVGMKLEEATVNLLEKPLSIVSFTSEFEQLFLRQGTSSKALLARESQA